VSLACLLAPFRRIFDRGFYTDKIRIATLSGRAEAQKGQKIVNLCFLCLGDYDRLSHFSIERVLRTIAIPINP
jgi:hypothetical protein